MKRIELNADLFCDALKCNRCGLCLQNCPVYRENKQERFSPRAKMQLAVFLLNNKLTNKDKKDFLPLILSCKNCGNCTALCPAKLSPQNINTELKNYFNVNKGKRQNIFKILFFKLRFWYLMEENKNLFITSSTSSDYITEITKYLKNTYTNISLYGTPLLLANLTQKQQLKYINKLNKIKEKTFIIDDLQNYQILENARKNNILKIQENSLIFLSKQVPFNYKEDIKNILICLSNSNQPITENDKQFIKQIFKSKNINFANSRYYYGTYYTQETIKYLADCKQNTFIVFNETEKQLLQKIIKKFIPQKKVQTFLETFTKRS